MCCILNLLAQLIANADSDSLLAVEENRGCSGRSTGWWLESGLVQ